MIRVHFKSPVPFGTTGEAFGYGRVFVDLSGELKKREDVELVDDPRRADLQVCWCQPYWEWEYRPWYRPEHPVQVLYTTWECTRIPKFWAREMNKMRAAFTTSKFCVGVFRECGVEVPVHLVGHGINAAKFPYIDRDFNAEKFWYIWQGVHPSDRKGMKVVHRAFAELDLPGAMLVEKWHPLHSRNWTDDRESQKIKQFGAIFPQLEYAKLLASCHVSINPSRGEGFGMIPFEAAATGMMTALTAWSGSTDYLDGTDSFWKIRHKLSDPGEAFFVTSTSIEIERKREARDAVPDLESVKEAIAWSYAHREEAKEMGREASRHIHAKWRWEKAATEFVNACEEVLENV